MEYTRVNNARLAAALTKAVKKLEEADELLAPFLELLTDSERGTVPRPPEGFTATARQALGEADKQPEITRSVQFDSAAVTEDLNNVEALQQVDRALRSLAQKVADARLAWTGEAYVPILDLYHAAKRRAESDGQLQPLVDAIAPLFASRRARRSKAGGQTGAQQK